MATRSIDTSAILLREGTGGRAKAGSAPERRTCDTGARFTMETVDRAGLERVRDAWKALAGRAAEPNVFYDPDFALPAIHALGHDADIAALLVWRSEGGDAVLTGVFPFLIRKRWGVPIGVGEAFVHPYAMSSAPLVDRDAAEGTVAAFFDWLDRDGAAPAAWLFRFLPEDGPVHEAIAMRAGSARLTRHGAYGRAVLEGDSLDGGYLDRAIGSKRRKEYRRLRRKLAERGAVTATRADDPASVRAGVEEFLALEVSGWKGERGTAAALSPAIVQMFEEIAAGLSAGRGMRIDALRVDGRPIAVAASCGEGRNWWLWKIAYDEAFAAYSPGVQLVIEITEAAIAAGDGEHYDSCALPGIPMIERIWRQRRPYADLLIAPAKLGMLQTATAGLEDTRRGAERLAKQLLGLVGRR